MSAIPKIQQAAPVDCPACKAAGGCCPVCGFPDCNFEEHEGWSECGLCGGTCEVDPLVAEVYARRAATLAAVPPSAPVADDSDISY